MPRLILLIFALFALAACDQAAEPVSFKSKSYYITGVVTDIAPHNPRMRYTLAPLSIKPWPKDQAYPKHLRLSARQPLPLTIGDLAKGRAYLMMPSKAVAPDAFNYAAFLQNKQIAATGWPIGAWRSGGAAQVSWFTRQIFAFKRWRQQLAANIYQAGGQTPAAAMATTLTTGEKGYIDKDSRTAMQRSGLAHILAISGMHMGLVAGLVFWLVRTSLAITPLAYRVDTKPIAAIVCLCAAFFYMLLAGAALPTQRAFVMTVVFCLGVITGREPFSYISLALAAAVVLSLDYNAWASPSFQLSFAAVLSLIWLARREPPRQNQQAWYKRSWRWLWLTLIATTLITFITAPFTWWHFQRLAIYSPLANILALPLISLLVMPGLLAAMLLWPTGLGQYVLLLPVWGLNIVLEIATGLHHLPGANLLMPHLPKTAFIVLSLGAVTVLFLKSWWRLLPIGLIITGLLLMLLMPKPILVFNPDYTTALDLTATPPRLVQGKGNNFSAKKMTEFYGIQQFDRQTLRHCPDHICQYELAGYSIVRPERISAIKAACALQADIAFSHYYLPDDCGAMLTLDRELFEVRGAVAVYQQTNGLKLRWAQPAP